MAAMILRAVDLCCGAGGWACAARGLPIQIELAIDLWEKACATYTLNHPTTDVVCGDLTDPGLRESVRQRCIGVNCVLGAIPCEWLTSYRRAKLGNQVTTEERGSQRALLDAVLDLTTQLHPRWWCLEDVIGLRKELPIFTPFQILDARHWSAQRRKRLFVGTFPKPLSQRNTSVLSHHLRPGPYRISTRTIARRPERGRTFAADRCLGAWSHDKAPTVMSITSRRDNESVVVAPELVSGQRQWEWQELAALQGFPADYVFVGSPTDVARMIGQALQIDLARAILGGIVREYIATTASDDLSVSTAEGTY